MTPPFTQARAYCYRCDKVQQMCVCRHLAPIANEVGVHVLQHPRERRHALGTARLLRLGLARVRVHVLNLKGRSASTPPVDLPAGAGLLYPSSDAKNLATLSIEERPSHLVVIDGTWDQAHRIFRDNPWISAIPCYRLDPEEGSRYRIRKEPRQECLSTVESVVAALRCLQPDLRGTETLITAFDAMIDAQIAAYGRESNHTRRKRARRIPPSPVPKVLLASEAEIVVAYTEAAPGPLGERSPEEPIRLSAVSLDGTRVFDQWIQSATPPDAYLAGRLELEPGTLETARPCHEVMAAFLEFCGARAVVVSWDVRTYRWLDGTLGDLSRVLLKGVWANISQDRVPDLVRLVKMLGLATANLPISGRAGRRLARAHAMARHIVQDATSAP